VHGPTGHPETAAIREVIAVLPIDCQEQQVPSASTLKEFQSFWSEFRAANAD
jgi:hypothetical protein